MTTEHITAGSTNHSAYRYSHDVLPETIAHFRPCIRYGAPVAVPETPFYLRTTALEKGCAFDLIWSGLPVFVNIGCWDESFKEEALKGVRDLQAKLPYTGTLKLPNATSFLYSVMLFPCPPHIAMLAGEIEYYIYETIRRHGYAD